MNLRLTFSIASVDEDAWNRGNSYFGGLSVVEQLNWTFWYCPNKKSYLTKEPFVKPENIAMFSGKGVLKQISLL